MKPASIDLKDILVSGSDFEFGTDLFISVMPQNPHNCISIFDTSNATIQNTLDNAKYHYESVMIWVRNDNYENAFNIANQIVTILDGKANFNINGTRYLYCSLRSGINAIGEFADINVLTMNFSLQRVKEI